MLKNSDPHRRTGRGGAAAPPKRSQSRANVQHKSGEEWEIKKPKSPQFVGQTKAVGQYSLHSRQYWLIIKRTGTNYVNFVVNLVIYGKVV
jgi:hypothetical protein